MSVSDTGSVLYQTVSSENYEEILGPDKLGALQITIDGPRDQHNTTRVHQNGFPTFDKILSNVEMALNKGCKVSIRMNTNMDNIDKISALHEFFEKKGFYKNPLFQAQQRFDL